MLVPELVPDGLGSGLAPSRGEEERGDLRQVAGSAHSVVGVEDQWRRAVAGAQGGLPRRDSWPNVSPSERPNTLTPVPLGSLLCEGPVFWPRGAEGRSGKVRASNKEDGEDR